MDGLTSADNVGAVVRSAVGFGADGLIVGPTCCPPYLRRSVHTSMGTLFNLPVHHASVLADTLHELSATGFRNIAAHPHADAHGAALGFSAAAVLAAPVPMPALAPA